MKKTIVLDGNSFSDLEAFYAEIDRLLTKDLTWQTGHNLDAFNDLLRGDFGVHDYEEPIRFVWRNFTRSKDQLGEDLVGTIVGIITGHQHIEFINLDD